MSHFTCLVIGDDPEKQLAPFHEFECTGLDDEFVQDIDETQSLREEFAAHKVIRYKDLNGKLHDPYTSRFYRDPTNEEKMKIGPLAGTCAGHGMSWASRDWKDGQGYRAKVHFLPLGLREVKVPARTLYRFAEWIENHHSREIVRSEAEIDRTGKHKYGYTLVNAIGNVVKSVDRTNPHAKYDWYKLGGRWTGYFKLKNGHEGKVGSPGLMTEEAPDGRADRARKGDIEVENMDRFTPHSFVKDGQWYERGRMGWWAAVHSTKDEDQWLGEFADMWTSLSDDVLISAYDCHI